MSELECKTCKYNSGDAVHACNTCIEYGNHTPIQNEIADFISQAGKYLSDKEIDVVNHPSHYETGKFECIEVMEEALGKDAVMTFCKCNAFKYLYRSNRKNGLEDLKKAQWYLNKYMELLDKELL